MADWPSVVVPNRIGTLFDYIKKVNRPPKITQGWLESGGFKSTNDRPLISLLKSLGYLDGAGAPTDKWAELKSSEADRRASIGRQLAVAYPEVFSNFPNEHIRDGLTKEELKDFVRPKVAAGEPTVVNVVATFFALKALASFEVSTAPDSHFAAGRAAAAPVAVGASPTVVATAPGRTLNVTINLSLEIPPTSDADVYDKLFAAMAKHLGSLGDRGTGH